MKNFGFLLWSFPRNVLCTTLLVITVAVDGLYLLDASYYCRSIPICIAQDSDIIPSPHHRLYFFNFYSQSQLRRGLYLSSLHPEYELLYAKL